MAESIDKVLKQAAPDGGSRRTLHYPQFEKRALGDALPQGIDDTDLSGAQQLVDEARAHADAERVAAYERGFAEGMEEGRIRAAVEAERQYEILAIGIEDALQKLDGHLGESAHLTRYLLGIILERLFGSEADHGPLVERLLAHQVSLVDPQELLAVQLAAADIEEPEDLRHMLDAKGLARVAIEYVQGAPKGTLNLRLRNGTIDAGLTRQRTAIETTLDIELSHAG